ncbi:MAG: D-alanine-D-alanine ligase-like ATP-grasp enzyme [Chlamydiales bacterium]
MKSAVFVIPFALESTLRFLEGALESEDIRWGVVTQEKPERLPEELRKRLTHVEQIENCLDAETLASGVRASVGPLGGQVDALIGILEQLQVPLAQVRQELSIRGMAVATAQSFRDKSRMKDILRSNGVPCARHHLASDSASALEGARDLGFPLVVKPPAGAGAKNTFRVDDTTELEQALAAAPPSAGAPVLLEEFIVGQEHSLDSVVLGGEHLFHSISRYGPTPLEVMQTPWIQWCVLLPREISGDEYGDARDAATKALKALGMVAGMTHMEWFRRPDGSLAISEVAARPPGAQFTTLISYAHDRNFYREWPRLCVLEQFTPPERQFACGAAYLRGQGRGRVREVRGLEEVKRRFSELIVEAKIPRIGQPQASSYEGEGYVILRHPETSVVEEALAEVVGTVQVELG